MNYMKIFNSRTYMINKIEKVIKTIKNESLEKLQDVDYLEYKLLPELGLNDRHLNQYPQSLHQYCGNGIDSWQYPNQFSKYLYFLSKKKIENFIEIGCHKGGTFIITFEYLSRFNNIKSAIAIDNWPRDIMYEYCKIRSPVKYLTCQSKSNEFIDIVKHQKWDLILIDGDHNYKAVQNDFITVKDYAKLIAFHDIVNKLCPGTQQMWKDIRDEYPNTHEWVEQYDEVLLRMRGSVMGIGLVEM